MQMSRIAVAAFSGGLDTSCIVSWLKEEWYGYEEVVAVLVDVGQEFDLDASVERARAAGADDVVLLDRKAAFAEEQCARAIKANALYEGKYPLVSALSRPVIAQAVARLAVELGAEAVVHGCTGKGNDQLRFELGFRATDPALRVIAPLRGRIYMIENRAVGIKSREVYEAPGAIALIAAHSALEDVVLTKDEPRIKRGLEQRWTELVYEGLWFSPAREAIDAFVDRTQELVEGEVRVELRPGIAVVTGRRSPNMLYAEQLASYGTGETFPHAAAEGFIRISSLEVELAAARQRATSEV